MFVAGAALRGSCAPTLHKVRRTHSTTAVLFPGQGTQVAGMGAALCARSSSAAGVYARAGAEEQAPSAESLRATRVAQPAIFVHSVALLAAARQADLPWTRETRWRCVAGHSLGEYSALVAANVWSFERALDTVRWRAQVMQDCCNATPSGLRTVAVRDASLLDWVAERARAHGCSVAVVNAPQILTVGGPAAGLDSLAVDLRARGMRMSALPVAGAFHTELMRSAADSLADFIGALDISRPATGPLQAQYLAANTTGELVDLADWDHGVVPHCRAVLPAHVVTPVLWWKSIQAMLAPACGVTRFVEVGGGGGVLVDLIARGLAADSALGMTAGERTKTQLGDENDAVYTLDVQPRLAK